MSSKSTRRGYQLQSPVNTRAQSKSISYRAETDNEFLNGNKVSNGQKKRKRNNLSINAQVCESLLNENNYMNNAKRMKKVVNFRSSPLNETGNSIQPLEEVPLPTEQTVKTKRNSHSKSLVKSSMIPRLSSRSNKLLDTGSLRKSRSEKKLSLASQSLIEIQENYVKQNASNDNANAQRGSLSMHKTLMQSTNTSIIKKESKNRKLNSANQGLKISSKSPRNISSLKSISKKKLERSSLLHDTDFDETTLGTNEIELLHDENAFKLKEPIVVLERLSFTVPVATSSLLLPSSASSLVEERRNNSNCFQNTTKFNCKSKVKNGSKVNSTAATSSKWENTENQFDASDRSMSSTPKNDKNEKRVLKKMENEQEEVEDKDATYELIEPITPNLRNKLKKIRDKKVNSKKGVRFMNRRSDTDCSHGLRLCTICDRKEELENNDITTIGMKLRENVLKSPINTFRDHSTPICKQTNTLSVVKSFTPSVRHDHKLKSVTNTNAALNTPIITPIKKPDQTCSATKTIPNFVEIHKRIFAKSESVVDAKRRLEKKHLTFMASMKQSMVNKQTEKLKKKDPLSNDSKSNDLCNQFGFKIRKNDATTCILKKTNLKSIRSKQQPTKEILKGVRTNRRFELQMKARNIKF